MKILSNSQNILSKTWLSFAVLTLVVSGCMSSNFTLTGSRLPALPADSTVKVVLHAKNDSTQYTQIGLLQIIQSDMNNLSKAVELAVDKARVNGGDIVVLISTGNSTSVGGSDGYIYSSEDNSFIFEIGKIND